MKYTNTIFLTAAFFVASTYAEDPWTPSPLCPFPSEDLVRFQYEGDCSKYWECYEGARYPMTCPAGLEFNVAASRCDTPSIANCDPDATVIYPTFSHSTVTTQPTAPTPDPGPLPECPFPSNDLTFFPVVTNCSQYWECFQGNRYLMTCPSGLYWNTLHNYCDYPENVDCTLNNVTSASPGTTSPGTIVTVTTTSPGDSTATTEPNTPWTPDPQCPYPSEKLTFFPHPTNCSQYYECFEGNKFLMSCPKDLLWNDLADACDYAENVNCNRTTASPTSAGTTSADNTKPFTGTTAPPQEPTTINSICANEPDGTYLPHPTDCRKFYECAGGKTSEEQCPGNLYWNVEEHTCDYPETVNCKNGTPAYL